MFGFEKCPCLSVFSSLFSKFILFLKRSKTKKMFAFSKQTQKMFMFSKMTPKFKNVYNSDKCLLYTKMLMFISNLHKFGNIHIFNFFLVFQKIFVISNLFSFKKYPCLLVFWNFSSLSYFKKWFKVFK